jgi:hypothetical protein
MMKKKNIKLVQLGRVSKLTRALLVAGKLETGSQIFHFPM